MSAYNPPNYYFSGIIFNPAFYASNNASLTQAQANALYLLKRSPDTATALETFTGGILTDSIQAVTSTTGSISLGASQTSGILNLGTGTARNATGVINISTGGGVLNAVNILNGAGAGGSVNIANGATQSTNINIGASDNTGIVNIFSGIGSSMNIASGTGARTITIGNTGNVVNVANIQVNNNIISSTSGSLTLGGSSTTLNVAGNLTIGTGKNITLQPTASYVAPTTDTMLGGITSGTFLTPGSSFSANKLIATIPLVKGTFIISYTFNADLTSIPTTDTYVVFDTTSTALPLPNYFVGGTRLTAVALGYSLSFPYSCTTAGTLVLRFTVSGGTINGITQSSYTAMRIA